MRFNKFSVKTISFIAAVLSLNIMPVSALSVGDVNEDGNIDSYDALMILNHCVGITELSDSQQKCADINSDGEVNSYDALLVLNKVVGNNETDYSSFIGSYNGLFGDERAKSYTATGILDEEKKLEITSFMMSVTSFDETDIDGSIILESNGFVYEMAFDEMQTVEYSDGLLHLKHKVELAEIDMDIKFDFNSGTCTGKINKAKITSVYYDFSCDIFFDKVD